MEDVAVKRKGRIEATHKLTHVYSSCGYIVRPSSAGDCEIEEEEEERTVRSDPPVTGAGRKVNARRGQGYGALAGHRHSCRQRQDIVAVQRSAVVYMLAQAERREGV